MPAARRLHSVCFLLVALATLGTAASRVEASALAAAADSLPTIPDSLRGRSGKLRLALLLPADSQSAAAAPAPSAERIPPVWGVADSATRGVFHFVELLPFARKQDGRIGAYTVGRFPGERRSSRHPQWGVPQGFVLVTPEMLTLPVSEHLTVGDFVPLRDQRDVWPRPLVLDLRLVDKLELILGALRDSGQVSPRFAVLSGFRTPLVTMRNARTAQAPDSRHQYGDAADLIVDGDGDGRMDDLNGDGRVDLNDARYLIRVVLAIEAAHPDLVGGIGVYRRTAAAGPFVHIDARGERARWGLQ
jgi:hypothetical protein